MVSSSCSPTPLVKTSPAPTPWHMHSRHVFVLFKSNLDDRICTQSSCSLVLEGPSNTPVLSNETLTHPRPEQNAENRLVRIPPHAICWVLGFSLGRRGRERNLFTPLTSVKREQFADLRAFVLRHPMEDPVVCNSPKTMRVREWLHGC